MAISKAELMSWLITLDVNVDIAIDDGGTCLVASDTAGNFTTCTPDGPYLEVGGIPLDEAEDS